MTTEWTELNTLQDVAKAQADGKPKRKSSPRKSLEQRFWDKVQKLDGEDACWIWIGATTKRSGENGYGELFTGEPNTKNKIRAHRYSYKLHHGEFDERLLVCHTCDNPKCVNPDHLFIGTYQDNILDCASKGRLGRENLPRKTHCKRGHEFTEENTVVGSKGFRWCKKCIVIRDAKRGRKGAIKIAISTGLIQPAQDTEIEIPEGV